jgi:hypothetical protein
MTQPLHKIHVRDRDGWSRTLDNIREAPQPMLVMPERRRQVHWTRLEPIPPSPEAHYEQIRFRLVKTAHFIHHLANQERWEYWYEEL